MVGSLRLFDMSVVLQITGYGFLAQSFPLTVRMTLAISTKTGFVPSTSATLPLNLTSIIFSTACMLYDPAMHQCIVVSTK
jgi:hypothetical protein